MQTKENVNNSIEQRLYELMQNKTMKAYTEWKQFFVDEFTENAELSDMQILLKIVKAYPMSADVNRLIADVMANRAQKYHEENDSQRALLASEIVKYAKGQIPNPSYVEAPSRAVAQKQGSVSKKLLVALGLIILGGMLAGAFTTRKELHKEKKICEQAAGYLNEKYDEDFVASDFKVEEAYLPRESKKKWVAYDIYQKDNYEQALYAIAKKGSKEFIYYDNLQTVEIEKAFQNKINELTGREDGKLFWNSEILGECWMNTGLFHTEYTGDIDAFFEKETVIRSRNAASSFAYGRGTAQNGNCDYYLPDENVETMEQRLEMTEIEVDQELQKTLAACAEKYKVQLRGKIMPKKLFDSKISILSTHDRQGTPMEEIYGPDSLQPFNSPLFMTSWYVNLPEKDANAMKMENRVFAFPVVKFAEGIYGVSPEVENSHVLPYDLENTFQRVKTPKLDGLTSEQRNNAISIQFDGMSELEKSYDLAIRKEDYGIADRGYRVFITSSDEEDGKITYETEECSVKSYLDPDAEVRYHTVLDGEGYIYVNYDNYWSWSPAPTIITIVNP